MDDFLNFIVPLCSAILGFITGVLILNLHVRVAYTEPMNALGIERFQKYEIHTTNCHSNWYEIVWKKDRK